MHPTKQDLLRFDQQHIWHPYTSATEPSPTVLIESAHGVRLSLGNGQQLIDGMASWWCAIHGYNHPRLNQAATNQLHDMAHVMFGGLTHRPAIDLCKTLIEITPSNLEHVFLADSGSVSVEVAIKMAVQYWQAKGYSNKNKMLSLKGGYHGDTFAAMSVCDPDNGMHHLFSGAVVQQFFTNRPQCRFDQNFEESSCDDLERAFAEHHHSLAALTIEPIVQGAGGMWFYHPNYLKRARELCDQYNVLLIADEIATGFGRTGKLFACEWANIQADILCVGKALTGGYMSLAASLCSAEVAHGISANGGVFMHGPTFMGNPLACSVANESLTLLLDGSWKSNIRRIEHVLFRELSEALHSSKVQDVRVLGAIGVIEMHQTIDTHLAHSFFIERGVWVRPFGKLLYIMPPYIICNEDLTTICKAMLEFVAS